MNQLSFLAVVVAGLVGIPLIIRQFVDAYREAA